MIIDLGDGGSGRSGVVGRDDSQEVGVGGLGPGLDSKPGWSFSKLLVIEPPRIDSKADGGYLNL